MKVDGSEVVYAPFGEVREGQQPDLTDFGFTGERLDGSSGGLLFYQSRYYLPELRRFISADTLVPGATNPQAFNRYSYTFNNPVKYVDPTGHSGHEFCIYGECYATRRSPPPAPPRYPGGGPNAQAIQASIDEYYHTVRDKQQLSKAVGFEIEGELDEATGREIRAAAVTAGLTFMDSSPGRWTGPLEAFRDVLGNQIPSFTLRQAVLFDCEVDLLHDGFEQCGGFTRSDGSIEIGVDYSEIHDLLLHEFGHAFAVLSDAEHNPTVAMNASEDKKTISNVDLGWGNENLNRLQRSNEEAVVEIFPDMFMLYTQDLLPEGEERQRFMEQYMPGAVEALAVNAAGEP